MAAKIAYDGSWSGGKIHVETDSVGELYTIIEQLKERVVSDSDVGSGSDSFAEVVPEHPRIPGNLGCADAIRALLSLDWAKDGRTESELTEAMKSNAVHYSHGTISGLLHRMTKQGELRRIPRKGGSYAYLTNREAGPSLR